MHNQGVGDADLTVYSTPSFGSGKIGNALISGGEARWTAEQTEKILNNSELSICFWVYIDAPEGDTSKRAMFFGNNDTRKFSLFQYPTCNDFHWSWKPDADTGHMASVLSGVFPSYKWTHCAITYKNPYVNVYINGENVVSNWRQAIMNWDSYADSTYVIYSCPYRKLNDYRVYDNCLSPREVKEISKGLVCHYMLSGVGGENLYTNTDEVFGNNGARLSSTTVNKGLIIDDTAPNGKYRSWDIVAENNTNRGVYYSITTSHIELNTLTENETYTVSFWARCSKEKNMATYSIAESQTILAVDNMPRSSSNSEIKILPKWMRHSVTFKWTSTSKITTCFYLLSLDENVTLDIAAPKLEKGSVATPWTPNPADTLYTKMGFDDGIEYDVSGYGRNGTKIGTITVETDTPRYWTSSGIENGNNHVQTPVIDTAGFQNSWTICAWVKTDRAGAMPWGSINGNRLNLFLIEPICNNTADSLSNPFMNNGVNVSQSAVIDNNWHHVAVTGDGTENILYIDGEYAGTAKTYKPLTATQFMVNGWNSSSNYSINGAMSDFRIYATALSAEDILALYNNPVSLSSNGALLTQGEVTE